MTNNYTPWHQRKSYAGASPEALEFIRNEAANAAERIVERYGQNNPAFIVEIMRELGGWADKRIAKAPTPAELSETPSTADAPLFNAPARGEGIFNDE